MFLPRRDIEVNALADGTGRPRGHLAMDALSECASKVIFVARLVFNIPSIIKIPVKIKVFAVFAYGTAIALGLPADLVATFTKVKNRAGDAKLNQ